MENLKKALTQGSLKNLEYTCLTKEGQEFPAELSVSIIRDALGNPVAFVGILKDITERKLMEQKLLKSERLAAIGELAAMVGHDLRNPLTGIAGATYYLRNRLGSKSDRKAIKMLSLVEKSIEYSNKIISDLLDYSKELQLELIETTPRSIVQEALMHVKIPRNTRVSDLTQDEPKILVDIEKMTRVFSNIIKNAVDAMPKGGKLTIESKMTNDLWEISFTDTGMGMSVEVLEKLWTPFFTTKAKGMGLGLPICKRITEAHEGKILVESIVGEGTTFTVSVPIKPKVEKGGEEVWMNIPESLLSTTTKT
jgi:signal transduction histidine kinase